MLASFDILLNSLSLSISLSPPFPLSRRLFFPPNYNPFGDGGGGATRPFPSPSSMGSSAATVPPPAWGGDADMTEDELEAAQVLYLLPKLILLELKRRLHPGYPHELPDLLRWGHRRPRSGRSHQPPPPTEPLPPLEEEEKGGEAAKTSRSSPPSPFQFPGSGYEEDLDRRPAKVSKKVSKSKKDYERAEEHKSNIASLSGARADLQKEIEKQKKLFQSLSENSFLLREAERIHQARLSGLMMPSPAATSAAVIASPVDPAYLRHKRSEESQTGGVRRRNAKGDVIPEAARWESSPPPAAASARRGFIIDLNVASVEMAELAAPPPPSLPLPTQTQQQSSVPLRPQAPPPSLTPSDWNHHHQMQLLQLRQDKAAKTAESRKRRREIQREKRPPRFR